MSIESTYKGLGVLKEFVDEWGKVFSALRSAEVVQKEFLGNPAKAELERRKFVIDFGG